MLKFIFTLLTKSNRKTITDEEAVSEYLKSQNNYYFEIIYNRYSSKVFGKCLTILKDESLAQDATQDVMMKILLNLSKFGGRSKLSTWIYSITYNFCIDFIRKRKKDRSVYYDDVTELADVAEEVSDKEILEIKFERLKVILDRIPTEDKSILLMKYMDGLSIKEIGDIIDKSESAIKMKIKRAKHKFVKIHDEAYV